MHCFGQGSLALEPLWLPRVVSQHHMPMLLTSHVILVHLQRNLLHPSGLLWTWMADSHSKAEERPGQPGNAGLSPLPLPVCFCQVPHLCWALGFAWPCPAGRLLSQRVLRAEHSACKGWQRWLGMWERGAPLAGWAVLGTWLCHTAEPRTGRARPALLLQQTLVLN